MNKAVFLDRDGVINLERGDYTFTLEDWELTPDLEDDLKRLKSQGYILIVVTNQGGIAKGRYDPEAVNTVHSRLIEQLVEKGIELTDIYYCPHHDMFGKCLCRKPGSLMIEKALARYDLNPAECYLIGDRKRDIDAGEAVGVKGILVESNTGIKEAVDQILA